MKELLKQNPIADAITLLQENGYEVTKEYATREKQGWVKCSERLPEESGQVLGIMKDTFDIYVCHYSLSRKLFLVYGAGADPISDMRVTHWMPLPRKPEV